MRAGGPGLDLRDVPFTLAQRDGEAAEAGWFDYALSPIREEGPEAGAGAVVAILSSVMTEPTA